MRGRCLKMMWGRVADSRLLPQVDSSLLKPEYPHQLGKIYPQ